MKMSGFNKPGKIVKTFMDYSLAVILILLSLPLFLVIAAAIKIESRGPFLFKQKRPGLNEKIFVLYKFRTMHNIFDQDGNLLPDEQRITRIGRQLRRLSLDELPELWNIVLGNMSFVGPRPLLVAYLKRYTPAQARRHTVKPGITGWAQVNGRNALTWEQKFQHDIWYIDNWSLWLDIKIIFLTIINVLKRTGISQPGFATAEEFQGNQTDSKEERQHLKSGGEFLPAKKGDEHDINSH